MSGTVGGEYHQTRSRAYFDGVATGLIVAAILGLGAEIAWHRNVRREAIEAGAGRYDAQSGEFKFGCTGGTR
jgi:hypothetical protein